MLKRCTHSILVVALTLAVISIALIGMVVAMLSSNMINAFEQHLVSAESAESNAVAARLNKDITQLTAQAHSLMVGTNALRLNVLTDMKDYSFYYAETAQNVEQEVQLVQSSNSLISELTLYLTASGRKANSNSLVQFDPEKEADLLEAVGGDLTILDGTLYFRVFSANERMSVLFKIMPLNVQRYLGDFMDDTRGSALALYVQNQGMRLFSCTETPLSIAALSRVGAMLDKTSSSAYFLENDQRYLLTWCFLDDGESAICKVTPAEKITDQMVSFQRGIMLNYALTLTVAICVVGLMYFLIERPIRRMRVALRQIRMGDFSTRIAPAWSVEFSDMFSQFNQMAEKIQTLIEREYELRLLHTKAELKQMQYQINPHFLYNTYFILRAMLYDEEYEQAIELSSLLGKYLRYITCSGQEYARLEEEIEHAQAYAQIQQIRFPHSITVEFGQCPPARKDMKIPRLLLQPLIENAFGHGMKAMENGRIAVSFVEEAEDGFEIRVEDNGTSMTDAQLALLRTRVNEEIIGQDSGIALVNIQKRLQFVFDRESGLRLYRSDMGGFGCAIHIHEEGRDTHAANADR